MYCLHSLRNVSKLKCHANVCKHHGYYHLEMSEEINLKFNHKQKSLRIPFVMYADTKFLLQKMHTCDNNPKESYTTKINKHTLCGYSLFTHCSFGSNNKHGFYRGEGPMKKFCADPRKHAIRKHYFWQRNKKKNEKQEPHVQTRIVIIQGNSEVPFIVSVM